MKSKNQVNIDIDELFLKVGAKFDYSTDFLVSTMRLYDDSFVDENEEEAKSFNGIKLTPLNVHMGPETNPFGDSCSLYLFLYHLDREDPKIVRPKLIRTIELADMGYHHFVSINHGGIMHFRVCGNILAVAKSAFDAENDEHLYGFEFYDMEKSRKGELDLIYTIENLSALSWCYDPILRTGIDYGLADPDLDLVFFSDNFFVCSRNNDDGNCSVEVHKISSEECSLVKNIELHAKPYMFMFVESHGNSAWNFFMISRGSPDTQIIYDKKKNELTATLEKYGELKRATERVLKKLESEGNVFGHVRLGQEYDPDTRWVLNFLRARAGVGVNIEWGTAYFKFYV